MLGDPGRNQGDRGAEFFHQGAIGRPLREVHRTVETAFNVKVTKVNTMNVHGKRSRTGNRTTKAADWKKAIVTLQKGQKIDLVEEAA